MTLNGTMELIQTVTVPSGGQANIEFAVIPQTYNDLKFVISGRTTGSTNGDLGYIRFNGSSSTYSTIRLQGDGSTAYAAGGSV